MADAVSESLRSHIWVVGELHKPFLQSGKDIHVVPALLLMDYADAIDGVSILAREGSAKNCAQLLRTGMELQLSLMYLLERDDTYEQRCLAYEYFHFLGQLRAAERCDPNSEVGKQLRAKTKGEPLADLFDQTGRDIPSEIKAAKATLDAPRYALVRTELARKKAKHWYGLWDGPASAEDLARHLKQQSVYDTLYRLYSGSSHGETALKRIAGLKAEELQMDPVRSPKGLPGACRYACALANGMTAFLVDKRLPHLRPQMEQRYIQRIKPGLVYIDSVQGLDG